MKVLITGANGFVGKNLRSFLSLNNEVEIFNYDIDSSLEDLEKYTAECDFVYHLAGVNRPQDPKEFMEGNYGFTSIHLNKLKEHNNKAPIIMSSSIQAELDNDYGKSKGVKVQAGHCVGWADGDKKPEDAESEDGL